MKRKIINGGITLIVGAIFYYIALPAINLSNPGFYAFLCLILGIYGVLDFITKNTYVADIRNIKIGFNTAVLIPVIFIGILLIDICGSPMFNAKKYANRITVNENASFETDIEEVDFTKTPLLDKASSQKLGDRVMGTMSDFVSQFYVSDLYTQINYNEDIVRVTPLEYADIIKYASNHKEGIKGYVLVNSVNGESKVIKLEEGMKYVPSAILGEDLIRHVRFNYPTLMLGDYTFEVDDTGKPYFIIPIKKYVLVGLREDISGILTVDPVSGEINKYDINEVPTWVDHVYSADLIIDQTNNWGTYQSGFMNSLFAEKNVVNTTEGYNYLAMNNDIYLYTGITSVQTDESNLGFILSNMRTKETTYYKVSGAEEFSAMASSEGAVQEKMYTATFPLLINLNGRATYLMSLKDDAGLVKKYSFVDVADYQKVYVGDVSLGIEEAANAYLTQFKFGNTNVTTVKKSIKIQSITTAIINGNTNYYIIDEDGNKYSASITINEKLLPFIKTGDTVNVEYKEGEINSIKLISIL